MANLRSVRILSIILSKLQQDKHFRNCFSFSSKAYLHLPRLVSVILNTYPIYLVNYFRHTHKNKNQNSEGYQIRQSYKRTLKFKSDISFWIEEKDYSLKCRTEICKYCVVILIMDVERDVAIFIFALGFNVLKIK